MQSYICSACGTTSPKCNSQPEHCAICEDERQYVPVGGQTWTTPEVLALKHENAWRYPEPDLFEIRTNPVFAIGQGAFLVRTPSGNVLWDCVSLLDQATKEIIHALGGLKAIAISHPHFYTNMQNWAQTFDVPVYLHARDRNWVIHSDSHFIFWEGDTKNILDGLTLIRLGGHFPGSSVLHWADGAEDRGVLLSGDAVQVAADTQRVSFMWSFPNILPLSAKTITRIEAALEPWAFERIYGPFAGRQIVNSAKQAISQSATRYRQLLDTVQE